MSESGFGGLPRGVAPVSSEEPSTEWKRLDGSSVGTALWDEILGVIDSLQYEYGGAVLLTLDGDRTTEDLRRDVLLMKHGGAPE